MNSNTRTTGLLEVPGAALHYEVQGSGPLVVLHAAPMDASAFEPIAAILAANRTVLSSDPRGIKRSRVEDPTAIASPDQRGEDLARLLDHVDAGPADVFGSSGGAVSALALLQQRPELVRRVIAHEPPLAELLPDRGRLREQTGEMIERYRSGDRRGYWERFLRIANIDLPEPVFQSMFSRPLSGAEAEDERFGVEQMEWSTTFWQPDLDRLREAPGLVVGIGHDSAGQLCDRTSRALASSLDLEPTIFPGDHLGFVDHPEAFATRLGEVLGR